MRSVKQSPSFPKGRLMSELVSAYHSFVPNLWSFEDWAPSQMRMAPPFQMPALHAVESLPEGLRLVPFDKRCQTSDAAREIVHFFIEDSRFRGVMTKPASAMSSLAEFAAVIGPDVSPYASHTSYMRATSIWFGKAISSFWQEHGLRVIPNVRWLDEGDLDFALCGVPAQSVLAVSTLGVSSTKARRACLRRGLEKLVREKSPTKLLIHGIDRNDVFGGLHDSVAIEFFTPRIYQAYAIGLSTHG